MPEATPAPIRAAFKFDYAGFGLAVDLELPGEGVTALFGPSGSGKTTLLRCVAGLNRAPHGFLQVNGEVWQDEASGLFVPTHRRPLGYVFQEASLFDHLTVRKNLLYGESRIPRKSRRVRLEQAVELLGIGALLERRPHSLSGGERQRVGMARALLTSPRILLLDEPLAALDLPRKEDILPYLERLSGELRIPLLYVSHSPDEVARLADHLVLLERGRVVAQGELRETLARLDLPGSLADEAWVVLETVIGAHHEGDGLSRLDFPGGHIWVSRRPEALGRRLRCRVHARDVSLILRQPEFSSILNVMPATVVGVGATGIPGHVLVRLEAAGTPLLARVTRRSLERLGIVPGLALWVQIKAVALWNP